jgi:putative spermidine/putrescine transport system permease protein
MSSRAVSLPHAEAAPQTLPVTPSRLDLWLRLSPVMLPFLALFCGGLALAVAQSLGLLSPVPLDQALGDSYRALWSDASFWASAGFSVYVASVSALLSVLLGALLAYSIWRLPRAMQGVAIVYKIALILPHVSVAFIILVLWTQSGFMASICHSLGLISSPGEFPALLYAGNGFGLILAYAFKGTGFATLLCLSMLRSLDPRLVLTARMLGAPLPMVLLRVVLPHLAPVMHTVFIILFLYAFGAFDIPFLLSESSPGMLSIKAYNLYFQRELAQRPLAMAMLVSMFLFSCLFIWLYTRLSRRLGREARKL